VTPFELKAVVSILVIASGIALLIWSRHNKLKTMGSSYNDQTEESEHESK